MHSTLSWACLGLTQQQRIWYGVLQFIPSSVIIWIGTIVALAVGQYCRQSNSVHFAHLWITIFKFIVTTVSIVCCLRFYSRMKTQLLQHRILLKLFTFKSIIGLNVAQTVRPPTCHFLLYRIHGAAWGSGKHWNRIIGDWRVLIRHNSSSSTFSPATAPSPPTNT